MQYGCLYTMPDANKIIDILQSERYCGKVIREIQVNFQCSEIAYWYNTWLGSYNSSDGTFEFTAVMVSVVFFIICLFICSFIYHLAEYNRATIPVLIKVSMTLSLIYFVT
jgi:hypothetical protein